MNRSQRLKQRLETGPVEMSAPCRLDYGGTLDISTFYLPLRHLNPSTFNVALDMRTRVRLLPYSKGRIKVTSKGFDPAEFESDHLVFSHPMGLMVAIAAFFGADSVHIDIDSASPPRSALGGSSVAAVALIAAFMDAIEPGDAVAMRDRIVLQAHAIESSVARVPCGIQDQLAAAYGGVHLWHWNGDADALPYTRQRLVGRDRHEELEGHILAAYCGEPHESININNKWVEHFLSGKDARIWHEIVRCCNAFSEAVSCGDYSQAAWLMRRETELRLGMTPDVLDETGKKLAAAAERVGCGARFTGAGGGGCVWAIGETEGITALKPVWQEILDQNPNAHFLNASIDHEGLRRE